MSGKTGAVQGSGVRSSHLAWLIDDGEVLSHLIQEPSSGRDVRQVLQWRPRQHIRLLQERLGNLEDLHLCRAFTQMKLYLKLQRQCGSRNERVRDLPRILTLKYVVTQRCCVMMHRT